MKFVIFFVQFISIYDLFHKKGHLSFDGPPNLEQCFVILLFNTFIPRTTVIQSRKMGRRFRLSYYVTVHVASQEQHPRRTFKDRKKLRSSKQSRHESDGKESKRHWQRRSRHQTKSRLLHLGFRFIRGGENWTTRRSVVTLQLLASRKELRLCRFS